MTADVDKDRALAHYVPMAAEAVLMNVRRPGPMRAFVVRYTLRDGFSGMVHTMAHSSVDALLIALGNFGDDIGDAPQRISVEAK